MEFHWPQRIPAVGEFLWLSDDRFGGYQVTRVEWTVDKDSEMPHPTKVVIYADEFSMGYQADEFESYRLGQNARLLQSVSQEPCIHVDQRWWLSQPWPSVTEASFCALAVSLRL